MPRVNVYIRDADWESWEAIDNKSEWISGNLQKRSPIAKAVDEVVETIAASAPASEVVRESIPTATTCKNGHPLAPGRDRCMEPGCKFSVYK